MIDYKEVAKTFGLSKKIEEFKNNLLKLPYIQDVEFDLTGYFDDIFQVIAITKYNIPVSADDYYWRKKNCKYAVSSIAKECGLKPSGDRIEDHGEHFYYVFDSSNWPLSFSFS